MEESQILFDFPTNINFSIKDFIQDDNNIHALKWLLQWPNWPNNRNVIFGQETCGKTHLAKLWINSVNGNIINKESTQIQPRNLIEKYDNFALDDIHIFLSNDYQNTQAKWLFDFLNILNESNNKYLLITTNTILYENITNLKDLASRLASINVIKMNPPCEDTLKKILYKLANDLNLSIKDDVIDYILKYSSRDIKHIEKLIKNLDQTSIIEQRNITIPLVKKMALK